MFAEGNIDCVEELLKPAKRVLKLGISVKHESFEQRVELWKKIRTNQESYLDEKCGTFLQDLDQHFCSLFDGSLLVLAASFRGNGESFGAADIFSEAEIKLFQNIERYNLFDLLSADDIRKKFIQKDSKVLNLLRDFYVSMDYWVNEQIENTDIRFTIRYYLKKRWDGYKKKLNQAVSSSVLELDWLNTLISSWESETKTRLEAANETAEIKIRRSAAEKKEIEDQLQFMDTENKQIKEQIKKIDEEKKEVEKQLKDIEAKIKKLTADKAFTEGKISRYVKREEVKQYELNFIGRLEYRLGNAVMFCGKNYKVENLKEIKYVDTSRLGEISGLSERDVKNLPENRCLVGNLTEKKLLGKKQRYCLKALFFARGEKYAKTGYDTEPLELNDLNACLVDFRDEAKEIGEWVLLCLASPTGFEVAIGRYISSEDFHMNFLAKYLSVCLLDLGTGKLFYNPHDEVAKGFSKLCELETESEKSEKLKLSVRKIIEEEFLLKGYVLLKDIPRTLGNDSAIKSTFYEYAGEKGYTIMFDEDIGLVMMK